MSIVPGFIQFKVPENAEQLGRGVRNRAFCGGVKISKKQYLTAAHCTTEIVPEFGQIHANRPIALDGEENIVVSIKYPKDTLKIAKKEVKCTDYSCSLPKDSKWKDVALVEVLYDNDIPEAFLPRDNEYKAKINQELIVSGNELSLGVIFIKSSTPSQITAVDEISGTVKLNGVDGNIVNLGDSGSPVWRITEDNQLQLVGVTSQKLSQLEMRFILLGPDLIAELGL
ncbi:MAG: trypsin-like serine protease [Bacteriovoracaceae bacterium]